MKLAIIDAHGNVLCSFTVAEWAEAGFEAELASRLAPRRWQRRKRAKLVKALEAGVHELKLVTARM